MFEAAVTPVSHRTQPASSTNSDLQSFVANSVVVVFSFWASSPLKRQNLTTTKKTLELMVMNIQINLSLGWWAPHHFFYYGSYSSRSPLMISVIPGLMKASLLECHPAEVMNPFQNGIRLRCSTWAFLHRGSTLCPMLLLCCWYSYYGWLFFVSADILNQKSLSSWLSSWLLLLWPHRPGYKCLWYLLTWLSLEPLLQIMSLL